MQVILRYRTLLTISGSRPHLIGFIACSIGRAMCYKCCRAGAVRPPGDCRYVGLSC